MTFPPDIGLLLYASSGFAMLIGLVFLVIARRMAQSWLLPHWAAAMLVLGIGSLGYALRPPNPWLSSILPNALLLIALLLFHRGALRVNNLARTFDWLGVSVVVIATAMIAWLSLVVPDLGTRVVVLSLATAFLAYYAIRHGSALNLDFVSRLRPVSSRSKIPRLRVVKSPDDEPVDPHRIIDPLLEKISQNGLSSLTRREREQLAASAEASLRHVPGLLRGPVRKVLGL